MTITHPNGNAGTVTVRNVPAVENSEWRGVLRNGTFLYATLDFRENGDVWACITECLADPTVEGYYCALKYGPKTFAVWGEVDVDSEKVGIKNDFEWHGVSRPTFTNAKPVLKPKTKEADYLKYLAGDPAFAYLDFVRALPMTVTISGPDATIVNDKYMQWLISLQPSMPPKELLPNLQSLFAKDRAFNNHKVPQFEISGGMVILKNTFKMVPLMCGRWAEDARVRVLGGSVTKWGKSLRPIEIIDTAQDYTRFHPSTHPHLFFFPVNSVRVPLFENGIFTGKYDESVVQRFHQMRGLSVLPIAGRGASVGYIASELII